MMKKLLVLVLVLGLTQAASAATSEVLVNGLPWTGGDVEGSDIITWMLLETPGIPIQPFSASPVWGVWVDHGDYVASVIIAGGMGNMALHQPVGDGLDISGNYTYFGTLVPGDGIVQLLEFHVPEDLEPSSWINITFTGNYGGFTPADIAIHVIPEPMTIALLGLGGLFLLRRRK